MKYLLLSIIVLIFFPSIYADEITINSPNYFEQQDNELKTISTLNNELFSFEVCSQDGKNFEAKYYCKNEDTQGNISLTHNSNNGCFYNNSNINQIPCDEFTLETTFTQNNREKVITRDFSKTQESNALDTVLNSPIDDLSPVELSYYLVLHASIKGTENQKAEDIYNSLKNSRNNNNKCWPEDECDIEQTGLILYNLKLAGYSQDSRILEDGKTYLESLHIPKEKLDFDEEEKDFEIAIEVVDDFQNDISCDYETNNNDENFDFENNDELKDLTVVENVEDNLEFNCDENIDIINYVLSEEIDIEEEDNTDELSYEISDSQKEDFGRFETKIQFEHDFSNNNLTCDITTDDTTQETTFTNQSSRDELTITKPFQESLDIECDKDFDYARALIFSGQNNKESFSNEDEFSFVVDDIIKKQFDFQIFLEYNFNKDTLTCDLKIDNQQSIPITIEDEEDLNISQFSASSKYSLSCDDSVDEIQTYVKDNFDRVQIEKEKTSTSSISQSIPGSFSQYECLGKESTCNIQTTLYSLMTYDDSIENNNRLEDFISSLIGKKEELPLIQTQNPYEDAGKFLHIKENDELIESLKFLQNNDGSWSNHEENSDSIVPTAWTNLGLQKYIDSEHISDSQQWIYNNEPDEGWDDISKNALAYLAIEDKVKPYLTIENPPTTITQKQNITIKNPTIFDLENIEVTFSDTLKNAFEYKQDLGDLSQMEEINLSLTPRNVDEKTSGTITINGISNEEKIQLLSMPISVEQDSSFSIKTNSLDFTDENTQISIPLKQNTQNPYSYQCSIESGIGNKNTTISENTQEILLDNSDKKTGDIKITFNCEDDDSQNIIEDTITLNKIDKTFDINKEELIIQSSDEQTLTLTNLEDQQQILNFQLSENLLAYLSFTQNNAAIAQNQSEEIGITINQTAFDATTTNITGEIIIDDSNNYEKIIPVTITKENNGIGIFVWIMWSFIIIFTIAFAILVLYRYRELQMEQNSSNDSNQEEEEVILE